MQIPAQSRFAGVYCLGQLGKFNVYKKKTRVINPAQADQMVKDWLYSKDSGYLGYDASDFGFNYSVTDQQGRLEGIYLFFDDKRGDHYTQLCNVYNEDDDQASQKIDALLRQAIPAALRVRGGADNPSYEFSALKTKQAVHRLKKRHCKIFENSQPRKRLPPRSRRIWLGLCWEV